MSFSHCFTKQAATYSKFRPTYPDTLFDFLAKESPGRELAWDVGTGNGQAARALAKRYSKVIATDVAEAQIREAIPEKNITFAVAPAEKSPLQDRSADVVTVGQAIHWFDLVAFYSEVRRVLRPGGLISAWSYDFFALEEKRLHRIFDEYARIFLAPYWSPRLKLVEQGYRNLPFPFTEVPAPELTLSFDWNYAQVRGYLDSWSASQSYKDKNGGQDPFETIRAEVETLWGEPARTFHFVWPLAFKVGRVG